MTTTNKDWFRIQNIDSIDSPALVVYPARVQENIRLLLSMIDDVDRLRPHVKTHKNREATRLMLDAGIHRFKCATIAEAEMLALCNAPDVLLAYQPIGAKLQRFIALVKKYPRTNFSCLLDHIDAAHQQSAAFHAASLNVPFFIDLNIGQDRTGIIPSKALALYEACSKLPGLQFAGFHAYDGHIRDKNIEARRQLIDDAFKPVEELTGTMRQKGYPVPDIIAGGSPSFPVHAQRKGVQCSPGTFVFWDKGYTDWCPEQPFQPAALVITRVISLPDASKVCLDLGHKSVAAENELASRIHFLNAPNLKAVAQSEEHLVVEAGKGHSWKIGDVLYGLPLHICPTIALYERTITVNDGMAGGDWKIIARDRTISI